MSDAIIEWVTQTLTDFGPTGVALLILVENLFPPIPSELILPLAGIFSAEGRMSLTLVWIAAWVGSVLGNVILYSAGRLVGSERIHRLSRYAFFPLDPEQYKRTEVFLYKYGTWWVLFSRCIPLLRSAASIPAGVIKIPLPRFLLATAIGVSLWNSLLIGAGYLLGQRYGSLAEIIDTFSTLILILLILITLTLLAYRHLRQTK